MSSKSIETFFLSTIDVLLISSTKKHLRRNKELIKLVHNNVQNLSSVLSCCNSVKSMFSKKDAKALSLRDNHIDSFITTTRKCLLRINKQLIKLD